MPQRHRPPYPLWPVPSQADCCRARFLFQLVLLCFFLLLLEDHAHAIETGLVSSRLRQKKEQVRDAIVCLRVFVHMHARQAYHWRTVRNLAQQAPERQPFKCVALCLCPCLFLSACIDSKSEDSGRGSVA